LLGLVYRSGGSELLDLYMPHDDTMPRRAAIIFVHGGGFTTGTRASLDQTAAQFTNYGYVGISIDYQLCPPSIASGWVWTTDPGPIMSRCIDFARSDTEAAIAWARKNAATYRIDPNRIVLWGESSGAITSLYINSLPLTTMTPVRAVVSNAGAIMQNDLAVLRPQVTSPVIFLHGALDTIIPPSAGYATYSRLQALGITAQWNLFPNLGHVVPITEDRVTQITAFLSPYVSTP
jgi:acetyl esterase/lipase